MIYVIALVALLVFVASDYDRFRSATRDRSYVPSSEFPLRHRPGMVGKLAAVAHGVVWSVVLGAIICIPLMLLATVQ